MTGVNRFPNIPDLLNKTHIRTSKAVLMETLYDLSEICSEDKSEEGRCKWVSIQIELRKLANGK